MVAAILPQVVDSRLQTGKPAGVAEQIDQAICAVPRQTRRDARPTRRSRERRPRAIAPVSWPRWPRRAGHDTRAGRSPRCTAAAWRQFAWHGDARSHRDLPGYLAAKAARRVVRGGIPGFGRKHRGSARFRPPRLPSASSCSTRRTWRKTPLASRRLTALTTFRCRRSRSRSSCTRIREIPEKHSLAFSAERMPQRNSICTSRSRAAPSLAVVRRMAFRHRRSCPAGKHSSNIRRAARSRRVATRARWTNSISSAAQPVELLDKQLRLPANVLRSQCSVACIHTPKIITGNGIACYRHPVGKACSRDIVTPSRQ